MSFKSYAKVMSPLIDEYYQVEEVDTKKYITRIEFIEWMKDFGYRNSYEVIGKSTLDHGAPLMLGDRYMVAIGIFDGIRYVGLIPSLDPDFEQFEVVQYNWHNTLDVT